MAANLTAVQFGQMHDCAFRLYLRGLAAFILSTDEFPLKASPSDPDLPLRSP